MVGEMQLPLVDTFDVVMTEGTVSALELSLELAHRGLRVGILSSASSLPQEIASCMRAWVPHDRQSSALPGRLGNAMQSCLKDDGLIHLGHVTEKVEDALLDAGVVFYYDTNVLGGFRADDAHLGVVVGGKFGMAIVGAGLTVDTTPTASVARSEGVEFAPRVGSEKTLSYVVHASGDSVLTESLVSETWTVNFQAPFAEFRFPWDGDIRSDLWYSRAILRAHYGLLNTDDTQMIALLREIEMDRGADDLTMSPALRLVSDSPTNEPFGLSTVVPPGHTRLLVCSPAAAICDEDAEQMTWDWAHTLGEAARMARSVAGYVEENHENHSSVLARILESKTRSLSSVSSSEGHVFDATGYVFNGTDPGYDQPGAPIVSLLLSVRDIPAGAEVVVVGAGTSGVSAASVAAAHGSRVICTDKHSDPGGANTTGGVAHYWFGNWSAYFNQHFQRLQSFDENRALPPSYAQLSLLKETGVDFLPRTVSVGTVTTRNNEPGASGDEDRVLAILVATANGLAALPADYFVDSTGDGDIPAWSGAPYTYGSERDDITLWCSFGKFHSGNREASRQYLTVADQRGLADITRTIIAARRQSGILGEAEFPQHYLVTRESRHIQGSRRVRYVDMLMDVDYGDSAFVCRSNVDIKGLGSSDASLSGFVEPKFLGTFTAHIPYGAMLPTGLLNVIVAGKAYSISHDGLAMARMQSDMVTMGAVAGAAADHVRRLRIAFRNACVQDLQSIWLRTGTIEREELIVRRSHEEFGMADADLAVLCDRASFGPMDLSDEARILSNGSRSVPHLRRALRRAVHRREIAVSRMLCCLGDSTGNELLVAHLRALLSGETLPIAENHRHIFPDHGIAPEPVFIIHSLALSREKELVPILADIANRLSFDPDRCDSLFTYAYAICYATERLPCDEAAAAVSTLLSNPAICNRRVTHDEDPRACADAVAERYAYLELAAYRALARCGSRRGWNGLIDYLADRRSFLHRSARKELAVLSSQDFGYDGEAWRLWMTQMRTWTTLQPFVAVID